MVTSTKDIETELAAQALKSMESEYKKLAELGTQDMAAFLSAVSTLDQKRADRVAELKTKAIADAKTKAEAQAKVSEVFKASALDQFKIVWNAKPSGEGAKSLATLAGELTTINSFIFRVDRTDGKLGDPTFITGGTKTVPTGQVRDHTMTANGTVYKSVGQAWKGTMGDTPAPSKSPSGRPAYIRSECEPLMKAAGVTIG